MTLPLLRSAFKQLHLIIFSRSYIFSLFFTIFVLLGVFERQAIGQDKSNSEEIISSLTSADKIEKIIVTGNSRIPTATILSYMELTKATKGNSINRIYDPNLVSQGIKKLYATGFFTDISTDYHQGVLNVQVTENYVINQIGFEGNKKVKDSELKKILSLKSGGTFSSVTLQRDSNTILDYYQKRGLFGTVIEPKIVDLPENRISIVFNIKESTKSKIEKIQFLGNHSYRSQELIRAILSKEASWYRFFSSVDLYDSEKTKLDEELLKKFYWQNGYLDFYIQETNKEISPQKNSFIVTFVLNEGPQYHFGEAKIESEIKQIKVGDLVPLINLKKGEILDYEKVENIVQAMKNRLRRDGYAFAEVNFNIERLKDNVANIRFSIGEGMKIYVNRINILNNVRTLDRVIRREMRIAEGDAYNIDIIERSKQRIINLGYFSAVEISPRSTNVPDKADLNIDVKEMSTGSLNFNVGYNTEFGIFGGVSLTENNLLGTGRIANLNLQKAQKGMGIAAGLTEPYFLNRDMFAGVDVFFNKYEYKQSYDNLKKNNEPTQDGSNAKVIDERGVSKYNSQDIGSSFKVGYDLSEYWRQILKYNIRSERYTNMSPDTSNFLKAQPGKNIISSVSHSLIYDKRDNMLRPTSGYMSQLTQELAGLGGDSRYLQNDFLTTFYFPLYKKDVILNVTGRAGTIQGIGDKRIRIIDNFFMGDDYIRGFESNGIGPRDKTTLDSLGGKNYYAGSLELNFPLGLPKEIDLSGAVFLDAASLYDIDIPKSKKYHLNDTMFFNDHFLRMSYGAGIIWYSPLGTIRVDYGVPVRKKKYDQIQNFRINFGRSF